MHEKIERALTAFLQFRKVNGLAPRTLSDYRYHIETFAKRITNGTDDFRAAALSYLGQDGIANNTFNFRFKYVKGFFDWGISEGLFNCEHPLKGLKKRKPTSRIINISNETIAALLSLPDRSTFSGLRDYALLLFSIDTGTRPTEALQLRADDFNFSQCTARIRPAIAKTRTERTVPISGQTADTVRKLLSSHHEKWIDAPVFCSADGQGMIENSWCHILKGYAKKMGENISPYALRHCCALSLLRGGASAFHVQRILGHSSISMTEKYISLTVDDLREAHSKASLINTLMPPEPTRYRQRKTSA